MITINNLNIQEVATGRKIISNLSFFINSGEHVALIGEEGNGKSTLLKAFIHKVDSKFSITGVIRGVEDYGLLEQDIAHLYGEYLLQDYFFLPFSEVNVKSQDKIYALDALKQFAFPIDIFNQNRKIKTLSGGELIRLALAKISYFNPKVILLDEPSNNLDYESIEVLKRFIVRSKAMILFVSHNVDLLSETAEKIIVLSLENRKQIAKSEFYAYSYNEYVSYRKAYRENTYQVAKMQRSEYQKQAKKYNQIYSKVKDRQDQAVRDPVQGRLLKKKMHTIKSFGRRLEKKKEHFLDFPDDDPFLNVEVNMELKRKTFGNIIDWRKDLLSKDGRLLVKNFQFSLSGGEHVLLKGKNGSGKTTFLQELYTHPNKNYRYGYLPQNLDDLGFNNQTPVEILAVNKNKNEITFIRQLLGRMLFTASEMDHSFSQLSGGQKSKVIILMLFVTSAYDILLLDEPSRNFAPTSIPTIVNLINDFPGAVIIVSHDYLFEDSLTNLRIETI
jgi:ATPase subunit of ABC transporter with duplicated ATPase domains